MPTPASRRPRRISLSWYVAGALLVLIMVGIAADYREQARHAAAIAAFKADLCRTGTDTPGDFIARCVQPDTALIGTYIYRITHILLLLVIPSTIGGILYSMISKTRKEP